MTFESNAKSLKSVIYVMNQFLRSVDEMDSTVLVPRRLMDVPACQLQGTNLEGELTLNNDNDLFKFYTMLLDTRNEIMWGRNDSENCPIANQLQQFSKTLVDLTDMANQLKDRYENDITGNGSPNERCSPTSN